jgi:hypothetical protein
MNILDYTKESTTNIEQGETGEYKPARDEKGRLLPGNTANPNGRPQETEEEKAKKKIFKKLIEDYRKDLSEALPAISPALIDKAKSGDINAIKEINDVLGMHKMALVGGEDDDNPIKFIPIYGSLSKHNGSQEDISTEQKD